MSGRVASSACRLFFEAEAEPVHHRPDSKTADDDASISQLRLKLAQTDMALRGKALTYPIFMALKHRAAVSTDLANRNITCGA
jgi:hypothetical protein